MNNASVQHGINKNQSSMNDDPFELNGLFKGLNILNHQKPLDAHVSNQRALDDYAQELVASYATLSDENYELPLDRLSTGFQMELAMLYIESIDREIEWACYGDDLSLNSDFLCALRNMLKNNTPTTRTRFAQITARNVVIYYKDTLQGILNAACEELYCYENSPSSMEQSE